MKCATCGKPARGNYGITLNYLHASDPGTVRYYCTAKHRDAAYVRMLEASGGKK